MELPSTTITGNLQSTTGTSVNGAQTSFTRTAAASAIAVPVNEDHYLDAPAIVCSQINETNELSGNKSLRLTMNLTSSDSFSFSGLLILVVWVLFCIGNKLNQILTSANVGVLTPYSASTSASGDNNTAIYMTKKVTLEQSATAIQVLFGAG